jgi:hypothetical protein
VFLVFILLQFIRPRKNSGLAATATDITHFVQVPDSVLNILKTSCYDCHSNHTNYPWYSEISPVSLWLANHIKNGKKELNFSDFSQYNRRRMKSKLSSIREQLEEREMPLKSYLLIHRNAALSNGKIKLVIDWTDSAKLEIDQRNINLLKSSSGAQIDKKNR